MKLIKSSVLFLIGLGCVGCSSMSTNTACKATATDSCLTIEQVDDMTRYADEVVPYAKKNAHSTPSTYRNKLVNGRVVQKNSGSTLWVSRAVRGKSWA